MKKKKKFIMIAEVFNSAFEAEINQAIEAGYRLRGDVLITTNGKFVQVMVHEEYEEYEPC